jgi:hypothetical protein
MPGSRKKKSKPPASQRTSIPAQLTTGMPARDSVQEVVEFVSPQGVPYKILKTTEMDAYDRPPRADKKRRKRRVP